MYIKVFTFRFEWNRAFLDTFGVMPTPDVLNGGYDIDLEASYVEWVGRNLLNKHWGTIAISAGNLEFNQGSLSGGKFTIDLNRIECTDFVGTDMHDILILER